MKFTTKSNIERNLDKKNLKKLGFFCYCKDNGSIYIDLCGCITNKKYVINLEVYVII